MKVRIFIFFVFLFVKQGYSFKIQGKVVSSSGNPIGGAVVQLIKSNQKVVSNTKGEFVFEEVTKVLSPFKEKSFFLMDRIYLPKEQNKITLSIRDMHGNVKRHVDLSSYQNQGFYYKELNKILPDGMYVLSLTVGHILENQAVLKINESVKAISYKKAVLQEKEAPLFKKQQYEDTLKVSLDGHLSLRKVVVVRDTNVGNLVVKKISEMSWRDVLSFQDTSFVREQIKNNDTSVYVGNDFELKPYVEIGNQKHIITWNHLQNSGTSLIVNGNKARVNRQNLSVGVKSHVVQASFDNIPDINISIRVLSERLKVMVWNIWGSSTSSSFDYGGKSRTLRTQEIIEDEEPDLIGIIETYNIGKGIANNLGYFFSASSNTANTSIWSKYSMSDRDGTNNRRTAKVTFSENRKLNFWNVWFTSPGIHIKEIRRTSIDSIAYDSYLSDHDYITQNQPPVNEAKTFFGLNSVQTHLNQANETPLIILGDMNSVSHLDYTADTKSKGLNFGRQFSGVGLEKYCISHEFTSRNMMDSYRAVYPEVTDSTLGQTWTTVSPNYIYDGTFRRRVSSDPAANADPARGLFSRIDHVYHKGSKLVPVKAKVVDTYKNILEDGMHNWPAFTSDHAGVTIEYEWLD